MKSTDILRLLLLAAIWGSSYIFIRIVAPVMGVATTMGLRVIIAALFLTVIALLTRQYPLIKKFWWQYLFLGAFNLVIPTTLVVFSVVRLNASMSSVLLSTAPIFTLLISRIWLKEKISVPKMTGLLSGMVGIVILVGWNPITFNAGTAIAFLALIAAAISYGVANVFARVNFSGANPFQTASGQLIGSVILVIPFMFVRQEPAILNSEIIIPLLFLGVVCTALAYILFFRLIGRIGSVNTSMVGILVPVFGILWASIFLQEPLSVGLFIGLVFIIGGLSLVLFPEILNRIFAASLKKLSTDLLLNRFLKHIYFVLCRLKFSRTPPCRCQ